MSLNNTAIVIPITGKRRFIKRQIENVKLLLQDIEDLRNHTTTEIFIVSYNVSEDDYYDLFKKEFKTLHGKRVNKNITASVNNDGITLLRVSNEKSIFNIYNYVISNTKSQFIVLMPLYTLLYKEVLDALCGTKSKEKPWGFLGMGSIEISKEHYLSSLDTDLKYNLYVLNLDNRFNSTVSVSTEGKTLGHFVGGIFKREVFENYGNFSLSKDKSFANYLKYLGGLEYFDSNLMPCFLNGMYFYMCENEGDIYE
jgi:hypothetical protein